MYIPVFDREEYVKKLAPKEARKQLLELMNMYRGTLEARLEYLIDELQKEE